MQSIRGRDISMIFQEPMTSLNPVFTVGAQIMEAIILHQTGEQGRSPPARRSSCCAKSAFPKPEQRVDSYPHQMSGGQKQRVMIAMALSCNPQLLIADEPTTALDVTIQAQILEILRKLRDNRGMAIIFITHDLGVIAEIADDVLVMFRGKEVEYGPVLDIFAEPQAPVHEGPARLPAAARIRHIRRLPTVDDFMETVKTGRRRGPRHRKEDGRRRGSSNSNRAGPRPAAASEVGARRRSATRGKKATTRPTRKTVAEGHRSRCLRVQEPAGLFPGPPRHPGPRRSIT